MIDPKAELNLDSPVGKWLCDALGPHAQPLCSKRLICGDASPVHRVDVAFGDHREQFVLRLFLNQGWLSKEPDLAKHEAAVLEHCASHDLPAPRLLAYIADQSACGCPAVLMTFLGGSVTLGQSDQDPWLREMAATLVKIHSLPADDFPWKYFSFTDTAAVTIPSWSKHPELWQEAIRIHEAGPSDSDKVFLHRDYHPVNLLWEGGVLVGVVDWVNACAGPAGVDVAHCCTNLASMHGAATANAFLQVYQDIAGDGFVYHPYWDIDSVLGWSSPIPGFYPPWSEYGIKNPGRDALFERQEQYLRSILDRI